MKAVKKNPYAILASLSKIDLWETDIKKICGAISQTVGGHGFALYSKNQLHHSENIPHEAIPPHRKMSNFLSFDFPINHSVDKIYIYYKKKTTLCEEERDCMQRILAIIAKAISIRQVSKDRIIESQIINELNLHIITTLDERKIIKQLETAARKMLATDRVLLFYLSDDVMLGTDENLHLEKLPTEFYYQIFNYRHIFTSDYPKHRFLDALLKSKTEQVTFVPLTIKNEVHGFFLLFEDPPRFNWNLAITRLKFLANQASIALERVELIKALNRALRESQGLQGLTKMMLSTLELRSFFSGLLKQAQKLLAFKRILLSLYDPLTETFTRVSSVGISAPKFKRARDMHPPLSAINTLMQNRYRISNSFYVPSTKVEMAVRGYELYKSPRQIKDRIANFWQSGDVLISPIFSKNRGLLGYISLDEPDNNLAPSVEKIKLLETFGDFLGLAIEHNQLFEKIEKLSNIDELTGVYNYRFLRDKLTNMIKENIPLFAIIMIDLDDFKAYNDRFGHLRGDEILKEISDTLARAVGQSGFITRYGGDEFIIVLPRADAHGASSFVKKILGSFSSDKTKDLTISFSHGVAFYPADGKNFGELIDHADQLVYAEKARKQYESGS